MLASDASLIVELALDRIGEDASSALGDEELIAPPLRWSEVPSVLHELAFRGEISRALGERALQRFSTGGSASGHAHCRRRHLADGSASQPRLPAREPSGLA